MIRSTGNPIGSLVMATGKVHLEFWWNLGMFAVLPLSIYIGSYWGLEGIGYSLVITMILCLIPMWYFMVRALIKASLREYLYTFLQPFIFIVISATTTVGVSFIQINIPTQILLTIASFGSVYTLLHLYFKTNLVVFLGIKQ